jgi:hypothetical protein
LSATLTVQNSVNNLKKFIADIDNGSNNYYYFIGGTLPWPNDVVPPTAICSYKEMESVYHDIVSGKLITSSDVCPLIPNIPWVSGVVYDQYDVSANLMSVSFYVVASDYSVYKCIDNFGGRPSIIQPSLKLTEGVFETSDGYTWKYMYTISPSSNALFTTVNFVPVVANTLVSDSSIPGTIDVYRVNNGGTNYQGFHEGMIENVISPVSIKLASDASSIDNFYNGSSLYLKTGLGAGQISNIVSYQGDSQIAYIHPPFSTFLNIQLSNINGTFALGEKVVQIIDNVSYLYKTGYFNVGDQVIQSDSNNGSTDNLSGYVGTSNSSLMKILNLNGTNNFNIQKPYPIFNTRNTGSLLTGNVTVSTGSNQISSTTTNFLTSGIAVNQFVRIGPDSNNNIRRITSINSSGSANVNLPFNNSLVNVNYYLYPDVVEPISVVKTSSNGYISATNINATILNYSNPSTSGGSFIVGELIKEYNSIGQDMNANGIVSFVNTSVVVLSNLNGAMTISSKIVGQTSSLSATISGVVSYPNITLENTSGTFESGFPVSAYNLGGGQTGNATSISFLQIPSTDVEYVVSPVATITGDGANALAYCIVNNDVGSVYEITRVVPINVGIEYTYANVNITAPYLYGSGANVTPVVSPISGHGADPVSELGGRHLGISKLFDTSENENYKTLNYGTYRRAGILYNPKYNDIFFDISSTIRNNFSLSGVVGTFKAGEIIFQSYANAAASIVSCNSSFIEIENINGTFLANAAIGNNKILGLTSHAIANVESINSLSFAVNGFEDQKIYDLQTNSSAVLTEVVSSNRIRTSSVTGMFNVGDTIYDPSINSYATISSISTANGNVTLNNTFGYYFNQTSRIPLTANIGTFVVGERVTQDVTNGQGLIIDTTHEIDLQYTPATGTIAIGNPISDTTSSANGIVTYANTSYIRITGVQGSFNVGDTISCITGSGTISSVFPVIVVSDVLDLFNVGEEYIIVGANSGALGLDLIPGTLIYPDLSKNTGDILYVNDMQPFTLSLTSKELFKLVLSF